MSAYDGYDQDDSLDELSQTEVAENYDDSPGMDTQLPSNPINNGSNQRKLLMWLIVASPKNQRGTVLPIADNTLIGRHGDIPWADIRMSRRHARFMKIKDQQTGDYQFAIKPEKDRNGTMVNGRKIKTTTPLQENDVIIMGDTRFVVKVLE